MAESRDRCEEVVHQLQEANVDQTTEKSKGASIQQELDPLKVEVRAAREERAWAGRNYQGDFFTLRRVSAACASDAIQAITRFRKTKVDLDKVNVSLTSVHDQLNCNTKEGAALTACRESSEQICDSSKRRQPPCNWSWLNWS